MIGSSRRGDSAGVSGKRVAERAQPILQRPRPSDDAAVIARMMLAIIARMTRNLTRGSGQESRIARASGLKLMCIWWLVTVATADGVPLTASQIARRTNIPRTSVLRYLKLLIGCGQVAMINHLYVAVACDNAEEGIAKVAAILTEAANQLSRRERAD